MAASTSSTRLSGIILGIILTAVGVILLFFVFFDTIPKRSGLAELTGKVTGIRTISGRDGKNYFYLQGYYARFYDDHYKALTFEDNFRTNDTFTIEIRKADSLKTHSVSNIRIWSLSANGKTYYTSKDEIGRQEFYRKYVMPFVSIALFILGVSALRGTRKKQ